MREKPFAVLKYPKGVKKNSGEDHLDKQWRGVSLVKEANPRFKKGEEGKFPWV